MILKGKKVILRPVRISDAPRFVKWFNEPMVHKFLNIRKLSLREERNYIRERLKKPEKDKLFFCIDTTFGTHIGSTALESINRQQKRATFGIIIGNKNYWNKGIGTEAARLIIDYGFRKLKLHRIDLDVYAYNYRAIKVYRRLGFKKEGIKREHAFWRGKYFNAIMMSVLDREWKKISLILGKNIK